MVDFELYNGKYKTQKMEKGRPVGEPQIAEVTQRKKKGIFVIKPYMASHTGRVDKRVTICVHDENFWPCIIRLDDKETMDLIEGLRNALEFDHTSGNQFKRQVGEIPKKYALK
jgi:hypothetical protein